MGMLREEPKLLRYYRCIKNIDKYFIDYQLITDDENITPDSEYWKSIFTYRRAFVGDMQAKFDETYKCNNMKNYAESYRDYEIRYVPQYIYRTDCSFKDFWKKIKSLFEKSKKEKDDDYFTELFTIKENENCIINPNTLINTDFIITSDYPSTITTIDYPFTYTN